LGLLAGLLITWIFWIGVIIFHIITMRGSSSQGTWYTYLIFPILITILFVSLNAKVPEGADTIAYAVFAVGFILAILIWPIIDHIRRK